MGPTEGSSGGQWKQCVQQTCSSFLHFLTFKAFLQPAPASGMPLPGEGQPQEWEGSCLGLSADNLECKFPRAAAAGWTSLELHGSANTEPHVGSSPHPTSLALLWLGDRWQQDTVACRRAERRAEMNCHLSGSESTLQGRESCRLPHAELAEGGGEGNAPDADILGKEITKVCGNVAQRCNLPSPQGSV